MKRLLPVTIGVSTLLLGVQPAAAIHSDVDVVTTVRADVNYGYNFVLKNAKHACGGFNRSYFITPTTNNASSMFSLLTAAFLSGNQVQVTYECESNEARVTQVTIGVP